ncbi:MAG: hypothetical protein V8S21_13310 [Lachnospira eligens]
MIMGNAATILSTKGIGIDIPHLHYAVEL